MNSIDSMMIIVLYGILATSLVACFPAILIKFSLFKPLQVLTAFTFFLEIYAILTLVFVLNIQDNILRQMLETKVPYAVGSNGSNVSSVSNPE